MSEEYTAEEWEVWKMAWVAAEANNRGKRGAEQFAEQVVESFRSPTSYRSRYVVNRALQEVE